MNEANEKAKNIVEQILEVIEELRPFINMDGGDIEFVRFDEEEKTVYVRLMGACAMCMSQYSTLEHGLLEAISKKVPEVQHIINVPL